MPAFERLGARTARPARFRSALAVAVLVTLVMTALMFSNTLAARRVADQGLALNRAEASLGATQVALKALSQAVLLAEDLAFGIADATTTDRAIQEAQRTIDELDQHLTALDTVLGDPELTETAARALGAGVDVVQHLRYDQAPDAAVVLVDDAAPAFESLRIVTLGHRDEAAAAVDATSNLISRVGNLPAFFAAFLIPAASILGYRRVATGQLRDVERQLDARLDSEHKLLLAKDEFVANLSHELRTPLTSIYGFSEVLVQQGIIEPEQTMELLGVINHESGELHRMIEDLLVMARQDAGLVAIEPVQVSVAGLLGPLVEAAQRDGSVVHNDIGDLEVWADRARLTHVLRNIVANVGRHGGNTMWISATTSGDVAAIRIEDDGAGVPPEKLTRLFTRYVHEGDAPLTTGTVGLGLAVVKVLVELMGGRVGYERIDGRSRFVVQLPLHEAVSTAGDTTPDTLPRHLSDDITTRQDSARTSDAA